MEEVADGLLVTMRARVENEILQWLFSGGRRSAFSNRSRCDGASWPRPEKSWKIIPTEKLLT
jgi:hypothetical protein